MSTIEVFAPALCCNTGVCGEDVDQAMVTFSADMDWIIRQGGDISRYNLAGDPMTFAENATVREFLRLAGSPGLPLVLVDGTTVLTGAYPDRAQLSKWAGLDTQTSDTKTPGAAAPAGVTAPAGTALLGLAEAGACCSTGSDNSSCC